MKRILQISNYMYPHIGGIEQVARDFARALQNHHIEQKIICFNETANTDGYECRRNETTHDIVDDIEVIRCGCVTKVASQSISLSYARELKRVMDEFKPDIVVFHYPNPFVAHYLLKYKKRDFKLVLYWHLDITKQKILGKLFHRQNIALIKRADRIIGATPKHINESAYSKYFEGKKEILPYAIDESRLVISEDEIKKAMEIRESQKGKVIGFFIGRHVPYKGLAYLIEASSKIKNDNIHFFIAGKGVLTEELMAQAQNDSKIEFIGQISDSEWRSYLYACDIFCFPSITRNEAFGLALAEGMYYCKPAVTFSIPGSGVNYVNIDGITGIECPNCDSDAYADALCKLAENQELRKELGINAQKRVLEKFTVQQFEKNVWNFVQSL